MRCSFRSISLPVAALLAWFSVGAQAQVTYAGTWTQQAVGAVSSQVPSPRYGASMASDAAGNVVLFGGYNGNYLNDTWVWNGSTWTQQSPAARPPVRYGAGMAYDAAHGVVVLFGGYGSNQLNDTWTWNGTNWTHQDVNADPATLPSPRINPGMASSSAGNIVLFGGTAGDSLLSDTWTWNGSSWTQPTLTGNTPTARELAGMAYDAASGQTVLFGGYTSTGIASDTWVWNGASWMNPLPPNPPDSRIEGKLAYDAQAGVLVLFGGESASSSLLNDTWTWNGSDWTLQSPPASPPVRELQALAYASNAGQVVLFGGLGQPETLGDTWTYQIGPVNKAKPTLTLPTASAIVYGQTLASSKLTGGSALSGSTIVAGTFTFTTPAIRPAATGTPMESVTFTPSNTTDYAVVSASVLLTVNQASTTTTVTSSMNPSGYGQPVTFTATIHSSAMGETGAVSWIPALCAPTPVVAGTAKCTVSTLKLGNDSIGASYSGDKNFSGSHGALPGSQLVEDALKFSAYTIHFGNVYLNSTVTRTLTLTNTGPTAVAISSVTIPIPKVSGSDAQEFVAHSLCPSSLAAGKSCTVTVSFTASVEDYSPSASLVITDSAVGSPQTIPLLATVIDPRLVEEPNSLHFGPQKAGTTSGAQKVALVNHGTTPLVFSALIVTAHFAFAAGTTCTSTTTLAAHKSCTLNVVFQPSSAGLKAGRIYITSNDRNPAQFIYLTGAGD